jgi:uncharacterized RDD family membrane protein YckC
MQTINVRTTQNVLIDYPLAGLWDRILAFLIDLIIFFAYLILFFSIFAKLGIVSTWTMILLYLPIFFYNLIFEVIMNGQTPGKRALNIKVVRLDGSSPTIGNYIMRFILWPIDIIVTGSSLAITLILLTEKSQRLGDLAAGTTVIKLATPPPVTAKKIIQNLNQNYTPEFPQVIGLRDTDIVIIKEALDASVHFGNEKAVFLLADKLKQLLGIHTDLPASQFLYTVLKDYHYLTANL